MIVHALYVSGTELECGSACRTIRIHLDCFRIICEIYWRNCDDSEE